MRQPERDGLIIVRPWISRGTPSLEEVREITHQWLQTYNEERRRDALGSLPPAVFRERLLAGKNSTSELFDGEAYTSSSRSGKAWGNAGILICLAGYPIFT